MSARRQELVQAAYQLIAEKGFEGFRTREVADKVGIHHATLHHHFATKEALVQAVVDQIVQELVHTHAPSRVEPDTALGELQNHFTDLLFQMEQCPERFTVLNELLLRARHDPAIAKILKANDLAWHAFLVELLERGSAQGVLQASLDLQSAAQIMMALIKGFTLQLNANQQDMQSVLAQIVAWIKREE